MVENWGNWGMWRALATGAQWVRAPGRLGGERRALRAWGVLAVAGALLLAGCGGVVTGGASATGRASATTAPTPTFTPTPQATVSPTQAQQACGSSVAGPNYYQVGDLYVSVRLTNLAYPSRKVTGATASKPIQAAVTDPGFSQQFPADPLINPNMGNGYFVEVCDAGTTAHEIDGLVAGIVSFTPYTGALNAWNPCNAAYSPTHPSGGGCGGGYSTEESLSAAFAANAGAGASVTATFERAGYENGQNGGPYPPLPVTLQPGNLLDMNLSLTAPTVAGYYSFAVGVIADHTETPLAPASQIVLLDPGATNWSGQACQTPAMQAQIPADSAANYICPAS